MNDPRKSETAAVTTAVLMAAEILHAIFGTSKPTPIDWISVSMIVAVLLWAAVRTFTGKKPAPVVLVRCGPEDGSNFYCCGEMVPDWFAPHDAGNGARRCDHCYTFGQRRYPLSGETEKRYKAYLRAEEKALAADIEALTKVAVPLEPVEQYRPSEKRQPVPDAKLKQSKERLRKAFAERGIAVGRIELAAEPLAWTVQRVWPKSSVSIQHVFPIESGVEPHDYDTLMSVVAFVTEKDRSMPAQQPSRLV